MYYGLYGVYALKAWVVLAEGVNVSGYLFSEGRADSLAHDWNSIGYATIVKPVEIVRQGDRVGVLTRKQAHGTLKVLARALPDLGQVGWWLTIGSYASASLAVSALQ